MTKFFVILVFLLFVGDNVRSDWDRHRTYILKNPVRLEYKHGFKSPEKKKRKKMYHLAPDSLTYSWDYPRTRKL
jgi:hypothetical protein